MCESVQGQKARIASLYFPLIPLVLSHVTRLDTGSPCYVSPMLNAASMAFFDQAPTPLSKNFDPVPTSATSSKSSAPVEQVDLTCHDTPLSRPLQP